MSWQSVAVVLAVAAAVLFLVVRFAGVRLRRNRPAQTFVPLSSLKKSPPKR
jgi:hypothetical protein